jgi:hypothetical protein
MAVSSEWFENDVSHDIYNTLLVLQHRGRMPPDRHVPPWQIRLREPGLVHKRLPRATWSALLGGSASAMGYP